MGVSVDSQDLRKRFYAKVPSWGGPPEKCWMWAGAVGRSYGVMALPNRGKHKRAHVLSYMLHKGDIPEGLEVCHQCNTKLCVNPNHLYAGTHAQNLQQAGKDGLLRHGEGHHRAVLTTEQVKQIRIAMVGVPPKGKVAQDLGLIYGVDRTTISAIANNKSWIGV